MFKFAMRSSDYPVEMQLEPGDHIRSTLPTQVAFSTYTALLVVALAW